jgi:bifunctional polynucleotide phosphatase/kinase
MKRENQIERSTSAKKQTTLNSFLNIKRLINFTMIENSSVLFGSFGDFKPSSKVAAFDFDGTIAIVKGAYVFPKNGDDWKWFDPSVPEVLYRLHNAGYSLVVFTNQLGLELEKNAKRKEAFIGRIENTVKHLKKHCEEAGLQVPPIAVFAATDSDIYRKPRIGMWCLYESKFNTVQIDMGNSFYCGDAAGRDWEQQHSKRVDHSNTDYKFALNARLSFYVPEQIFNSVSAANYKRSPNELHARESRKLPKFEFDPTEFTQTSKFNANLLYDYDLIILVGSPASGKSFFCETFIPAFVHINQDTLKTVAKCKSAAKRALDENKKVVIDNTNPMASSRKLYLDLANGKKTACVWFQTEKEVCEHNNAFREYGPCIKALKQGDTITEETYGKHVPAIAMHSFWKNLEPPTKEEGFDHIYHVPFHLHFQDKDMESYWKYHY